MTVPRGVASAKQLATMQRVLEAYCEAYGVTDKDRRDEAASIIMDLFARGTRDEEALLAELAKRRP
jgi:hypothetical protein